jgi:hypothetical protein
LALHGFELGAIVFGGAQCLALRQQEIASEAVLYVYNLSHLAELGNAFK